MAQKKIQTHRLAITIGVLLLIVFGGVVFHAPLTVWVGTLLPGVAQGIKAWKEVLLAIAALLLVIELTRRNQWSLFGAELWKLVGAYLVLHLLSVGLFWTNSQSIIAGLLIDGRFIAFLILVYGLVSLEPWLRKCFLGVFFGTAGVSMLFAFLQVTVLPHDILASIGYDQATTIAPYLTVDQNMDYIRINGTLRGPNPLGAYAVIVISFAGAALYALRKKLSKRWRIALWALTAVSIVALWFSYSRSALGALVVAFAAGFIAIKGTRISRNMIIAGSVAIFLVVGSLYVLRDTHFVSQVILHEDPNESGAVNSNDGHIESLVQGVALMFRQPFGAGVGSTGSASLTTDKPLIIENYYLFVAHEAGWLGAVLFVIIYIYILWVAWRRRKDWLAMAVLASGLGLAGIGFFLPVWVDDTVSLVWWGLAGLVLAQKPITRLRKRSK